MKKLLFSIALALSLLNFQLLSAEEIVKAPDSMPCNKLPAAYTSPEPPWSQLEKYDLSLGDDPTCEIRVATFAEGSRCIPEGYVGGAQKVLVRAKGRKDGYLKIAVCTRDGMRDSQYWGVSMTDSCAWDPWFCIWTDHEWDAKLKREWY